MPDISATSSYYDEFSMTKFVKNVAKYSIVLFMLYSFCLGLVESFYLYFYNDWAECYYLWYIIFTSWITVIAFWFSIIVTIGYLLLFNSKYHIYIEIFMTVFWSLCFLILFCVDVFAFGFAISPDLHCLDYWEVNVPSFVNLMTAHRNAFMYLTICWMIMLMMVIAYGIIGLIFKCLIKNDSNVDVEDPVPESVSESVQSKKVPNIKNNVYSIPSYTELPDSAYE